MNSIMSKTGGNMERAEKIPVPVIATFLSFLTMGNVYGGLGFPWLRYLIMVCGTVFIICYIIVAHIFFPVAQSFHES